MAQAPRQTGGEGAADFIRHIVTDPKNVPDVMLLTGYLGASSEEAHERLYLSADLTNYVEIPNTAILHQVPLPKEQDAHGGVTLWVKKDAALQYKMAPAAQALANYFAGAIQAGAQGAAPAAQPMPATLGGPVCGITQPNVCQVASAACTFNTCGVDCTGAPICQSHFHTCVPCITQNRTPCPAATCGIDCTVIGPGCGSHFHTCAPCVTQNRTPCPAVSCGIDCTVFGPACQSIHVGTCILQCNPTHGQPQCPFPTEATCVPVCAASPAPACGPNTIGGCSAACFPGQFPGQQGPVAQAAAAPQAALAGQANASGVECASRFFCTPPQSNFVGGGCTQAPQCLVSGLGTCFPQCTAFHCTQPPNCLVSGLGTCNVFCPSANTCVTCVPDLCGKQVPQWPPVGPRAFQPQALQQGFGGGNVSGWWFCHQHSFFQCSINDLICGPHTANTPCCPM